MRPTDVLGGGCGTLQNYDLSSVPFEDLCGHILKRPALFSFTFEFYRTPKYFPNFTARYQSKWYLLVGI